MVFGRKGSLQSYKKQPVPNLYRSDEWAAMHESKLFVAACYLTKDVKCEKQSSINRELLWNMKAKKGGKPSLKSIPPTDEALDLNIRRARYQSIQWHNSLHQDFVRPDACQYGWSKDFATKSLHPIMLPPETMIAPEEVMISIKCACKSSNCNTNMCGCKKIGVVCSEFCLCINCENCDKQSLDDKEDACIVSDVFGNENIPFLDE